MSAGFGVRGAMGPGVCVSTRMPGESPGALGFAVAAAGGATAALAVAATAAAEGASAAALEAGVVAEDAVPGNSSGDKLGGASTA